MSPTPALGATPSSCFPRVSGDEPGIFNLPRGGWLFSPRERG